jgi:hypothetical protein
MPRAPVRLRSGQARSRPAIILHSGDVLRAVVVAVIVQRWTDAQKELEGIAETVSVIAIESVGTIIDCELRAETDVDPVTV